MGVFSWKSRKCVNPNLIYSISVTRYIKGTENGRHRIIRLDHITVLYFLLYSQVPLVYRPSRYFYYVFLKKSFIPSNKKEKLKRFYLFINECTIDDVYKLISKYMCMCVCVCGVFTWTSAICLLEACLANIFLGCQLFIKNLTISIINKHHLDQL